MGLMSSWSARAKKALESQFLAPDGGTEREDSESLDARWEHRNRSWQAERRARRDLTNREEREYDAMAQRMSWENICNSDEFRGRWVALDECRYDEETGKATEGAVVDCDDDLVELCARMRESERQNCAILFCGEDDTQH